MLDHFPIPGFISGSLDPGLRLPQLNSVRHLGLEGFQLLAGIFRAFTAKLHSPGRGAFCHRALGFTVKAALVGTTSVALHFLQGPFPALRHYREPFGILPGADKSATCGAKQAANRRETLVRRANVVIRFVHAASPSFRFLN